MKNVLQLEMLNINTVLTLKDLPPPPSEKSGWPWTEQSNPLPEKLSDDSAWPRISVVTPSYNQEQFLEEAIRSVLLQNYPNLEYILIDGGSTDGSVEIIQKYESYLNFWVSESDDGQSHAINKGFAQSSGHILCWINSDDMLKPGALELVAKTLKDISMASWLVGSSELINTEGLLIENRTPSENITHEIILSWSENWFPQQSTFWTRAMWNGTGPLNEILHYAMDYALWLNMLECATPIVTKEILSAYRFHIDAKTGANGAKKCNEMIFVLEEYLKYNLNAKCTKLAVERSIAEIALHSANQHLYYRGNYTEAKQLLGFAIQKYPQLLLSTKGILILIKLILGEQGLAMVRWIKNFYLQNH